MGLYQNGHFTNAAAILYAKNPVRYLPQAKVRLTVYADEKSSDSFYMIVFMNLIFSEYTRCF